MSAMKSDSVQQQVELMARSFSRLLGRDLLESGAEPSADELWHCGFALLSHGAQSDPLFNYANQLALTLFERDLEAFIGLPSRLSSARTVDEDRTRLLERVAQQGYIEDYSGIRVSASGRLFEISDAIVWNLHDDSGRYRGQAAKIGRWRYVDD